MSRRVQFSSASFGVVLGAWVSVSGCAPTNDGGFIPLTTVGQGGSSATTTKAASTSVYIYGQGGAKPATGVVGTGGAVAGGGAAVGAGGATVVGTQVGAGGTPVVVTTPASTGGAPVVATTAAATNPNTGTTVTFAAGKGVGAMTGYGFVSLGALDAISSPTCGAALTPITSTASCAADPNWSSATALCVTGSVPKLDATTPDYTNNWGLSVGLNATDPATKGLGQTFSTITITTTGTPTTGTFAMIHRLGDAVGTSYCAPLTSGAAITLTSFITDCYNGASAVGTKLTAADVTKIDKISVQVSSTKTAAITVTNLCITGITFS